jgi:hypothetical protein
MGLAYIVVFLGDIFSAVTGTDDLKSLILPHLPFPSLPFPSPSNDRVPCHSPLMLHCAWFITGTPKHVVNFKVKLNPFAAKMLMIHRYFDISAAKRDLKYEPIIEFKDGWAATIAWFKVNWLPKYIAQRDEGKSK